MNRDSHEARSRVPWNPLDKPVRLQRVERASSGLARFGRNRFDHGVQATSVVVQQHEEHRAGRCNVGYQAEHFVLEQRHRVEGVLARFDQLPEEPLDTVKALVDIRQC